MTEELTYTAGLAQGSNTVAKKPRSVYKEALRHRKQTRKNNQEVPRGWLISRKQSNPNCPLAGSANTPL